MTCWNPFQFFIRLVAWSRWELSCWGKCTLVQIVILMIYVSYSTGSFPWLVSFLNPHQPWAFIVTKEIYQLLINKLSLKFYVNAFPPKTYDAFQECFSQVKVDFRFHLNHKADPPNTYFDNFNGRSCSRLPILDLMGLFFEESKNSVDASSGKNRLSYSDLLCWVLQIYKMSLRWISQTERQFRLLRSRLPLAGL